MPLKSTRRTRGSVNKASAQTTGIPNGVTVPVWKENDTISENILNILKTLGKDVKNIWKGSVNEGKIVSASDRPRDNKGRFVKGTSGVAENTERALAVVGQENGRQVGVKRQIHIRQSQIAIKSAQIVVGNVQGLMNTMNPKPNPNDLSPSANPKNPNQQNKKQQKEQELKNKKNKKDKISIAKGLENIEKFLGEIPNSIKGSLLGPLNLILEPLGGFMKEIKGMVTGIFGFLGKVGNVFKKLIGGVFTVFKAIGGFGKRLFLKFTNKKPTADEVLKKGGQAGIGAVYLGNMFKKIFGSDEEEGFLDKLFGGLGSDFLSALTTLGLGAALAGMIMDGIEASALAEEWGVSQTSAIIGGIFGGTGSGWNNALKKAGQGALLGGTIGTMICPGLGTIIGALLGASIFGILGYIGGEKIAQWIEKIGEEIKKDPSLIVKAIVGLVAGALVLKKVTSAIGSLLGTLAGKIFPTLATSGMSESVGSAFMSKLTALGAFVSLGASIAMMVSDGLKGVALAKEWGVSETNAFMGAFLGGTSSGVLGALSNAPKGMLAGAGIGTMICPGLGTIIGAFLGGGIAGALGYIGGEEISKKLQEINDSFDYFSKAEGVKRVEDAVEQAKPAVDLMTKTESGAEALKAIAVKEEEAGIINVEQADKERSQVYASAQREAEKQASGGSALYGLSQSANAIAGSAPRIGLRKILGVNDAIIKPNGDIVRTSPNDTIIATKNIPYNLDDVRVNSSKELNQNLSEFFTSGGNGSLSQKLDRMISLMGQFVDKQISVELPPQNRADLELLMAGGAL